MLKRNRLVCIFTSIMFLQPCTPKPFHNQAWQLIESKVDNKEMVQVNNLGLVKHPIELQYEKDKLELEKKKAEEQRIKKLEEQKKNEQENYKEWHTFVLTYYGLLSSECGNINGITASGRKVSRGMVASPPNLKFGTKIIIEDNEYIVEDRGSSKYIKVNNDGSIRLDVYLPRLSGESDREYYLRIQDQGVKRVKGYILK